MTWPFICISPKMPDRRTACRYRQDQPNSQPWSDGRESGHLVLASSERACRRVAVITRIKLSRIRIAS